MVGSSRRAAGATGSMSLVCCPGPPPVIPHPHLVLLELLPLPLLQDGTALLRLQPLLLQALAAFLQLLLPQQPGLLLLLQPQHPLGGCGREPGQWGRTRDTAPAPANPAVGTRARAGDVGPRAASGRGTPLGRPGARGKRHHGRPVREGFGRGQKGGREPAEPCRAGEQWGNEGGKSTGTRRPHARHRGPARLPPRAAAGLPAAACCCPRRGDGWAQIGGHPCKHPDRGEQPGERGSRSGGVPGTGRGGGRVAGTAAPARAQLIAANGIAHEPVKLLSSCLPPPPPLSLPERAGGGLTGPASHPAPPAPYPGTWPAPRAAPSPACASPGLFGHLQQGDTVRAAPGPPPQPQSCASTSRARRLRAVPVGRRHHQSTTGHPPQAPTLLGPGAGSRSRGGCSRRGAVAAGRHILRGSGCATWGALGIGGGPFTSSWGRGLAPAGQRLCRARGGSSMDGDWLASGVGRCLFFGVLRHRGLGGSGGGPVTPGGDALGRGGRSCRDGGDGLS